MRKLKLDSLQVDSFETTAAVPAPRGTVQAHARTNAPGCGGGGDTGGGLATFETECTLNAEVCGDTNYLECTYGCSLDTACAWC